MVGSIGSGTSRAVGIIGGVGVIVDGCVLLLGVVVEGILLFFEILASLLPTINSFLSLLYYIYHRIKTFRQKSYNNTYYYGN